MNKEENIYECVFIIRHNLSERDYGDTIDNIERNLESNYGKIEKYEYWGTRDFSYEINFCKKGIYVMFFISMHKSKVSHVKKIDLYAKSNDNILRYLCVRRKSVPTKDSPMLIAANAAAAALSQKE